MLEWVNTSTLSELCSAVNKLSRLFNITCNSFAVSDNNIDHIDGLGHKPSNSEFKKINKINKMTRDQVLHHVQIWISGSTNQNRRTRHLLKPCNSTALLDSWHNPFKSGSSYVSRLLSWTFCAASSRPTEIDVLCPMCFIVFINVLKKMPVKT